MCGDSADAPGQPPPLRSAFAPADRLAPPKPAIPPRDDAPPFRHPFDSVPNLSPCFRHALVTPLCHAAGRRAGFRPENGHGTEFWHEKAGFGAPSEGVPGKRPGREFRTRARRGRSVPELGSVAIFRPFSCMRTPPCPARPTRRRARLNSEASLSACDSIPVLLSLSDDIPALSPHPFPTLLPLLATQSRVLRLARNPHGEPFPRRLLDGRAVERSTRFAHLRKTLSRWWFRR